MPFSPPNVVILMTESKRGKTEVEKQAIDEDIYFLQNMMSDRTFTYSSQDNICANIEDKRHKRASASLKRRINEDQRIEIDQQIQ